jgi:PAS domain S-box-containing protein
MCGSCFSLESGAIFVLPRSGAGSLPDAQFHLAAIVSSSDDAIISKDLNGIITSWNEAASRVFGFSPEEIIGGSILRIVPPELHEEEGEILSKMKAGERIRRLETVGLKKTGERFPVWVSISLINDANGRVIGVSKIFRDISERRQTDESRFRLAAIVDSADDAIVSKDLNGIVRSWNQGARRMFGYAPEEIIGKSILTVIPEHLRGEEDEILRKLRAGERIDHYETVRMRKSGELFEVSVTISPIKDERGKVIGASKIARDISDRKRIEKLLVQSEKLAATGRMAAAIAHEINNPLESLMNLIFLARQNISSESIAAAYLATAEQEIERVSHIARQTLGYYRDNSQPVEIYLHDLLENVLTVYKSRLVGSAIQVETQFNDLQKILVSKGEMLQIFSNIAANAIDAMDSGGLLRISTRKIIGSSGDGIQIVVQDSGVGIRTEHLPKIFDPFFTTKGALGTGLGLWVARQLIEKRGGQIAVASSTEKDNSGTAITIFLPLTPPPARSLNSAQEVPDPLQWAS